MPELPAELREVFVVLDEPGKALADHDVALALNKLLRARKSAGEVVTTEMRAEWMAFDFHEDYEEGKGSWGTYYGPQSIVPREGGYIEWPSLHEIGEATLEYWGKRAVEAKHALLRARYADLVWDLSIKVLKRRPDVVYAQIAVDSYVEQLVGKTYAQRHGGIACARRALSLAIGLKDQVRIAAVRDAILKFDQWEARSEDGAGIAFDLLIGNKKVALDEVAVATLIAGQEKVLADSVKHAEDQNGFPFSIDHTWGRLASHYRSQQKPAEVRRIGGSYAGAKIAMARRASPMLGAAWLRETHEKLIDFGCSDEAESVALVLRELGKKSMAEIKEYREEISIPRAEVEAWLDEILAGDLNAVMLRVVMEFMPDPAAIAKQVRKMGENSLTGFLSITNVDRDGRQISEIGSVEDDLEGRVVQQTAQQLQIAASFLHEVFRRLLSGQTLTADILITEMLKSPLFEPERREVLMRGIESAFAGDHLVAAHILLPQIEHALRRLLVLVGSSAYKTARRHGGLQLKTLGDLLADEKIVNTLGVRACHYLRVVLTDSRGWNLRNDILHGIFDPNALGWATTNQLLHIVVMLGLVGRKEEGEPK